MAFYDLSKEERLHLIDEMQHHILEGLTTESIDKISQHFQNEDTYIRKTAYIITGKIYFSNFKLQAKTLKYLNNFAQHTNYKVRQTAINAAGEIGKKEFEKVKTIFDNGLFDAHHAPRNAVIGSIKKMGAVNPQPILEWAKQYLKHESKEIRREICHGLELYGRKHPEAILPLLYEMQNDKTSRVRKTLIHVLGQIAYKKNCLETVLKALLHWENKNLVFEALTEILAVHQRYYKFSFYTQEQARAFIEGIFKIKIGD